MSPGVVWIFHLPLFTAGGELRWCTSVSIVWILQLHFSLLVEGSDGAGFTESCSLSG